MKQVQHILSGLLPLLLVVFVHSCANIVKPNGGDKDTEGPVVIGVIPAPSSLNFSEDEVVFYFDEFLKPGNYAKEIFISPVPQETPRIKVKNKKVFVRFMEP